MTRNYDIIIVGGGAAGFFTAINIAEKNRTLKIAILERGKDVLEKVRISGGGRCNVTHACYDPRELVKFYPRGEKELRGPFHAFSAADTVEWFERHGVALKTEADGRMFPVSDSSQTIIDCLLENAKKLRIEVLTGQSVQSVFKNENAWKIDTQTAGFACSDLVMATGSNTKIWELLRRLGHSIVEPVPSLFTFNIKDARIKNLMGISAAASVKINGTKLEATGPLLITHWGMSGPAILRLSAWGARILSDKKYKFSISVNWLNGESTEDAGNLVRELKGQNPKKLLPGKSPVELPNRLWESIVAAARIENGTRWADLNKIQLQALANELSNAQFNVDGKSTFKEEFVTAGGIELREVNLKTMRSKLHDHLYFAGEILNIDAITGGFNFQNAWTGGFIVAQSLG
ncbi:MAG: NAD(P)/FAD-dependent oxidoreductase [Flavobacterium sp.]|nr:MAG: NAD(P)/FAD-dependent oxidoreductase [Flavobacterium sp.]